MSHSPSLLFALFFSVSAPAFADVAPENTADCESKAAGDDCKTDTGTDGACVRSTCTRLDYSNGTPPTSVTYDCLICDPSALKTTTETTDKSSGSPCGVVSGPVSAFGLGLLALVALLRRRTGWTGP